MVTEQNLYQILNVDRRATQAAIHRAYKLQSIAHHPDRGGSTEMMQKINLAYEKLSDPQKRSEYDHDLDLFADEVAMEATEISGYITTDQQSFSSDFRIIYEKQYSQHQKKHWPLVDKFRSALSWPWKIITRQKDPLEIDFKSISGAVYKQDLEPFRSIYEYIRAKGQRTCPEIGCDFSVRLTPDIAFRIFTSFINGNCYGETLEQAKIFLQTEIGAYESLEIVEPNISLYKSIYNILSLTEDSKSYAKKFVDAINQITNYAIANHVSISGFYELFANKYYRNLCLEAMHLYCNANRDILNHDEDIENDIDALNEAKECYRRELRDIISENSTKKKQIIIKLKLLKYLQHISKDISKVKSRSPSEMNREIAYMLLDWVPALGQVMTSMQMSCHFLRVAQYFLKAALLSTNKSEINSCENLATVMIQNAVYQSKYSQPQNELYILVQSLKYLSVLQYIDEPIKKLIHDFKKRAMYLSSIFPFFLKKVSMVELIEKEELINSLSRSHLHFLYNYLKLNRQSLPETIDHEYTNVLYEVYEGCIKGWYQESFNSELAKAIRVELMQELLAKNLWFSCGVRRNIDYPWVMVARDELGWLVPNANIQFITGTGAESYQSLDAIVLNKRTAELTFRFKNRPVSTSARHGYVTLYDVMEMLNKNLFVASFSLDEGDTQMRYHPFNTMRFEPSRLYKTQLLNTMLITDYLLKFFTVGQEVQSRGDFAQKPLDDLFSKLPRFLREIIEEFQDGGSGEKIHRFWIEAEEAATIAPENIYGTGDNLTFASSEIKMVVKKHAMVYDSEGKLVDTNDEENEGWDVYVLTDDVKRQIELGNKKFVKPSIIIINGTNQAYFYHRGYLSKVHNVVDYNDKLRELLSLKRDVDNKIIISNQKSNIVYRVYKAVKYITAQAGYEHKYSREYVFAQEFTHYYDVFGLYFAEFARLRELSKILVMIRLLHSYRNINKKYIENIEAQLAKKPGVTLVDSNGRPINLEELKKIDRLFNALVKEEDVCLDGECLWVPANMKFSEAGSRRIVYGGVRINPQINPIKNGSPQFHQLLANSRTAAHTTVNNSQFAQTRQTASQMHASRWAAAETQRASTTQSRGPTTTSSTAPPAASTGGRNNTTAHSAGTTSTSGRGPGGTGSGGRGPGGPGGTGSGGRGPGGTGSSGRGPGPGVTGASGTGDGGRGAADSGGRGGRGAADGGRGRGSADGGGRGGRGRGPADSGGRGGRGTADGGSRGGGAGAGSGRGRAADSSQGIKAEVKEQRRSKSADHVGQLKDMRLKTGSGGPPYGGRSSSPKRPCQILRGIRATDLGTYRIGKDGDDKYMVHDFAETFAGTRYTKYQLEQELVVYRVGNAIKSLGRYYTLKKPTSEMLSRIDSALPPRWSTGGGAVVETGYKVFLPRGTIVRVGEAGQQNGIFVGGTQQIFVYKPWAEPGVQESVERFDIVNAQPTAMNTRARMKQ